MYRNSEIITFCKNCIFFDSNQIRYCTIHKLEKLIQHGGKLVTNFDKSEDDIEIHDRVCRFYRSQQWGDSYDKESWYKIAREESKIHVGCIVYVKSNDIGNVNSLNNTIKYINDSDILPKQIIFAIDAQDHKLVECIKFIRNNVPNTLKYTIEVIVDKDRATEDHVIKLLANKFKTQYILFLILGEPLERDYLTQFDNIINDECARFIMAIDNDKYHKMIIQKMCILLFRNEHQPIIDIIRKESKDQDVKYLCIEDILNIDKNNDEISQIDI